MYTFSIAGHVVNVYKFSEPHLYDPELYVQTHISTNYHIFYLLSH